jgi:hypothetical protein
MEWLYFFCNIIIQLKEIVGETHARIVTLVLSQNSVTMLETVCLEPLQWQPCIYKIQG